MKTFIHSFLILIVLLKSTTGSEVIYARVGDTVTLNPPAGYDLQKHYMYWRFGDNRVVLAWYNTLNGKEVIQDKPWNKSLSFSDRSLVIKDIQQEFFGTFYCKLTSERIENEFEYNVLKLNVMSPPSPLLPGEPLTLNCNPETPRDNQKKPEIHWVNPRGEDMKNNQGILTATATGQDNGQWTCVVKIDKTEKHRAKISVTVVDLSPAQSPQYTSVSSPFTVPCSIPALISWDQIKAKGIQGVHWHFSPKQGSNLMSSGGPQLLFSLSLEETLTWKADRDRGLTPAPDPKKGNLSVTKKEAGEDDRGEYVCALTFNNGVTLNRTVRVEVLQITSSPGTELISGQEVNLTCSLGRPLSSGLTLKWLPPGQSSLPSLQSAHHPTHLPIPAVGTRDGGKWRCELWQGDKRLTSAVITLKIEPKLSVWMLVIICSVTVIVLLLILVFILYRRRKTRHLQHRQFCRCKNPKPKGFYTT